MHTSDGRFSSPDITTASYSIEIQRLALNGSGVGRVASEGDKKGKVAFVPYSLPGETMEARCAEEKKTYLRCIPHRVLQSSPDRIQPLCPYHFASPQTDLWCGGCNWQHMTLQNQREAKKNLVLETLHRLGKIPESVPIDLLAAKHGWRYRNTVQFVFGSGPDGTRAGFHAPGTHDIVSIDDCLIQSDAAVHIFTTVRETVNMLGLNPYERKHGRGWLKHLLVRSNGAGEALAVFITANASFPGRRQCLEMLSGRCPEITGMYQNIQPSRNCVITGREWIHLGGNRKIRERLCGITVAASPASFLQVNTSAAELLYARALEEAHLEPDMSIVDLYCGIGCLAILAAPSVAQAIGIDGLSSAIWDARENARENGIENARFFALTAERFLRRADDYLPPSAERLVVFVDPPRSGCQRTVTEGLLSLAPYRIIYLSCNPATLARDLEALSDNYQLASLAAVDLFPQTSHIETIARLERKSH